MARKVSRDAPRAAPRINFWGRHAVAAALDNPDRVVRRIWGTRDALAQFDLPKSLPMQFAEVTDLARMVARDAPHQGIVAEVEVLPDVWLGDVLSDDVADNRPLLVLDQVTDPHNVGAILRSAAAFNARALITQDRHSPPETGVLAKAASGALEVVPWVRVVNLARALDEIAESGFWRIGLAGEAKRTLSQVMGTARLALVMGAEGEGLRQNTIEHCDELAKLPMSGMIESLNVSNAAAIALYAAQTRWESE